MDELRPSRPSNPHFQHAIERVFESWSALQLAVEHSFGGPDSSAKARWLVEATDEWFGENPRLDPYEVEDFLAEIMNAEFATIVDDGSTRVVAENICGCFELVKAGRLEELAEKVASFPRATAVGHQQQQEEEQDEEEEEEEEQMDTADAVPTTSAAPTISAGDASVSQEQDSESKDEEDDGWTVVKKDRSKKR